MRDDDAKAREWTRTAVAVATVVASIALSLLAVLTDLHKKTAAHDAEHKVFREDILELRRECFAGCRKQ